MYIQRINKIEIHKKHFVLIVLVLFNTLNIVVYKTMRLIAVVILLSLCVLGHTQSPPPPSPPPSPATGQTKYNEQTNQTTVESYDQNSSSTDTSSSDYSSSSSDNDEFSGGWIILLVAVICIGLSVLTIAMYSLYKNGKFDNIIFWLREKKEYYCMKCKSGFRKLPQAETSIMDEKDSEL